MGKSNVNVLLARSVPEECGTHQHGNLTKLISEANWAASQELFQLSRVNAAILHDSSQSLFQRVEFT